MQPSARIARFGLLSLGLAACHVSTNASPNGGYPPGYAPAPLPPNVAPQATPAETFRPRAIRQHARAPLFLPGSNQQRLVAYDAVEGQAVMEGDITLGPVSSLLARYGLPPVPEPGNRRSAVATSNRSHLWPGGRIPYVIESSARDKTSQIQWAASRLGETSLQLVPRTNENDYVVFKGDGSGCYSYVGRIGGGQEVQVADCGQGSIIHEVLHAAGFYHEQSRGDRDGFVTIMWDEIDPDSKDNFEKRTERAQDIGEYDYGSIMHYSSRAFSRTGKQTIVPRNNASIGQREGLSAKDKSAIAFLYGDAPRPPNPPPSPTVPPPMPPPSPTTPPPSPAPVASSFAGTYASTRGGDVSCQQSGDTVNCSVSAGGTLLCRSNGMQLDCSWTGGGVGRALFQRQSNGVLAGSYGDFLSTNSRGSWNLTPAGSPSPVPPSPPGPKPPAPAPVPPGPSSSSGGLAGNFESTRGPMNCNEAGSAVSCSFVESGATGSLLCTKDPSGTQLSCSWTTAFPRLASGRAMLRRSSPNDRNLTGTWGHVFDTTNGGSWNMQGR